MKTVILLTMLVICQGREELPVIQPGDVVQGTIEEGDPVVPIEITEKSYLQAPAVE